MRMADSVALIAVTALALVACNRLNPDDRAMADVPGATSRITIAPDAGPQVVARARTIPTYPCRDCHDLRATNPERRELKEYHTTIKLNHTPALSWCDRCHDFNDFNQLHLTDGSPVPFDEAFRVCGQCHGEKYRDWLAGDHGLQTGSWAEVPVKRSCTACHSPHDPKYQKLKPMPPPDRPRGYVEHAGPKNEQEEPLFPNTPPRTEAPGETHD